MGRNPPYSAAAVAADVAEAVVTALDRLGSERGLNGAELTQLTAFEGLLTAAREGTPGSRSIYRHDGGTTATLRAALERCAEATAESLPLIDLLGMRAAVAADWHRLPVTLDTVLWLGVTRLADELGHICSSGTSSIARQKQLAAVRDLQGALGRVIRASLQTASAERDGKRAIDRVDPNSRAPPTSSRLTCRRSAPKQLHSGRVGSE